MKISIFLLSVLIVIITFKNIILKRALKMTVAWLVENGIGAPTEDFKKRYTNAIKRKYRFHVDGKE